VEDKTSVATVHKQKVAYALSIGTEINDIG